MADQLREALQSSGHLELSRSERVKSKVRSVGSSVMPVIRRGREPKFLVPGLLAIGLGVFAYVWTRRRSDLEPSSDFEGSLDPTAVDHGNIGAA